MDKGDMYLKNALWGALVFFLAAGFMATFISDQAMAQTRPAIVKNIDEPGRVPYQYQASFWGRDGCDETAGSACSNFAWSSPVVLFDLPPVPAGKRLIIRHISGEIPTTHRSLRIVLQTRRVVLPQCAVWTFWGPFFQNGAETFSGFSAETFITYGPGETPHVNINMPGVTDDYWSFIAVSGYLINAE